MPLTQAAVSTALKPPATLGRYEIVRELGRGAQGCVYLANDAQLGREVAIKTLAPGHDPQRKAALLAEARTTAQLQHPHIVTLYDAFEDRGMHCVVLEYLTGETLQALVRKLGRLAPIQAAAITTQILDGLAYAHERGIVHRDIKPANILIDASGNARIMDFGIATAAGYAEQNSPAGTPRYMAPESMDSREVARSADVFSVGMTLYEMLTGRPAVDGRNVFEVLHKIANHPFQPPSAANADVDEGLDQVVMRALAKDPAQRYADAREMRRALEHYCRPPGDAHAEDADHTTEGGGAIDFLLKRMRHKSSFPALSQTISAINRITAGPEQNVQALSEVLLKDFALTNKLLRLVNSTGYGQFGGTISTISRAVLILGFDAVRDLAVTLVLFDHLQNKGQAAKLRDDVIASLFNGIVARRVARTAGIRDPEEGFISGVFHNLGRLLAAFYLYEECTEIARRMQQPGADEKSASKAVLGVSYEELGIAIGRSWNLPPGILASMRRIADGRPSKPTTPPERFQLAAAVAEAVTAAATSGSPAERDKQISRIAARFGSALTLDERQLAAVSTEAVDELLADSAALLGDTRKSAFCQGLRQTGADTAGSTAAGSDTLESVIEQTTRITSPDQAGQQELDPAQVLAAGIQDITNSLVDNFNLSDLLRIILETMYRGMGFARVVLFMRDSRTAALIARLGYGPDLDRITGRLSIPLGKEQDVFSVVLAKNVDILINDVNAENIRARIPDWFRKSALGQTFVLLPIVIDARAIGLFYGEKATPGELTIAPKEMNLLKTLRNQAVLALRQKR